MADRTSAGLFGMIFDLLAENPTEEHKEIAKKVWSKTRDYDFSNYQMYCDESLIKLGLAKLEGRRDNLSRLMEETKIYSKKGFLELLSNNIKEDDVIIMSAQIEEIRVIAKRNCKTVSFGFAANAFKKDGVKHLMNGETMPFGFCIAKKETLTDEVLEIVKQIEEKQTKEEPVQDQTILWKRIFQNSGSKMDPIKWCTENFNLIKK